MVSIWLVTNVSCSSQQNVLPKPIPTLSNPKLIFLNYKILKDDSDEKKISLINKIKTDGKLKTQPVNNSENGVPGDLLCLQLDKNSRLLARQVIKNPLIKTFEYIGNANTFEKKTVTLDSCELSIRMQLHPDTKSISIEEIVGMHKKSKPLIMTKIE
jgi:hypothetical protein